MKIKFKIWIQNVHLKSESMQIMNVEKLHNFELNQTEPPTVF